MKYFITLEGGEGCGKSTHSRMIVKYLEERGEKVVLTHEPGGTPFGKSIREVLLRGGADLEPVTELMLFEADRLEHVRKVIAPALKRGEIVVCDRFIDSTSSYQIGGSGLPEDMVGHLNEVSSGGVVPDLTILLDIDPVLGLERAGKTGSLDRFESERIDFHRRVRRHYEKIASSFPGRVKVVDSSRGVDEVSADIRKIIDENVFGGKP